MSLHFVEVSTIQFYPETVRHSSMLLPICEGDWEVELNRNASNHGVSMFEELCEEAFEL